MTRSELCRLLVLNHLLSGALVNSQAASLLGISIRQVRRLHRRYETDGAAALPMAIGAGVPSMRSIPRWSPRWST